jgi:hypothetical protein
MPINQEKIESAPPLKPTELDHNFLRRPVQDLNELRAFVEFVKEHKVKSYLEIGSKYGGSLWHVANALPRGSRVVAVDLPYESAFKRPVSKPYLERVAKDLRGDYDMTLILGDSTDPDVVAKVRKRAPFDLCLIDANHEESYVRADWANYGPMAKMVAFHDISWNMARNPSKLFTIDVPKVWQEISMGRRVREIRLCPTRDNGFGILWNDVKRSDVFLGE